MSKKCSSYNGENKHIGHAKHIASDCCLDCYIVLTHVLHSAFKDVQLKVKTYLLGTDMSNFKYDDFIVVLDIISRLMQVGEEFCGSKSEVLQESIRKQSVNYFKNYH
ncbi:hypothetical protein AB205_0212110, partial [Aquarana catesbeiana]